MKKVTVNNRCFFSEEGGAVVEVAILSLVMVPMAIYAIFFFDYAFINLKVSEAARYAAWEMTAMQISDWKDHKHLQGTSYLNDRMTHIVNEVKDRWGDDMNGATAPEGSLTFSKSNGTLFSVKKAGLTVTEFEMKDGESVFQVDLTDSSVYTGADTTETPPDVEEPSKPNDLGIFKEALNKISGWVSSLASKAYAWLGFNVNGFIETEVSVKLKFNKVAPIYKGESLFLGSDGLPLLRGRQKIVVDAWDLKDGSDADYGQVAGPNDGGAGVEYKNQVAKVAFAGVTAKIADMLGSGGENIKKILNILKVRDPFDAVVRSFALKHATAGSGVNLEGALEFGDSRSNPIDSGAPSKFYTNTFKDTWSKTDSSYYGSYVKQSPSGQNASMKTTGYYMGCDKPEIVDRQDCWQN